MAVTLEQARLMQQQIGIQYVRKMSSEKNRIFLFSLRFDLRVGVLNFDFMSKFFFDIKDHKCWQKK